MGREKTDSRKELYVEIGQRIGEVRRTTGMTQEVLATEINVSTQYISNLERGIVGASAETLIRLCRALNASSDYILMGKKTLSSDTDPKINLKNLNDDALDHISQAFNLLLSSGSASNE